MPSPKLASTAARAPAPHLRCVRRFRCPFYCLNGERQSFSGERFRKLQTHGSPGRRMTMPPWAKARPPQPRPAPLPRRRPPPRRPRRWRRRSGRGRRCPPPRRPRPKRGSATSRGPPRRTCSPGSGEHLRRGKLRSLCDTLQQSVDTLVRCTLHASPAVAVAVGAEDLDDLSWGTTTLETRHSWPMF